MRAPYRLSYGQLDKLRQQLDSYFEKGHICPSTSPYAAPVLFVQKADGMQRICIDFTGLNKITVCDKFPIPHPEELLSRLHGQGSGRETRRRRHSLQGTAVLNGW
uniref:Reverse transcriptase domain-containing protein n=1 Tax=Chromera velia CCMP2878 TaxID=1169474 RepID=A0A0G4H427_9ALVE|eukprot:Cvel_24572.t1-p1 / transcript=Cvel_24572.t1 / gene=Cvel_24572 / organism=Chromera_velia_CCMP2878 / gene_product=Transposon Ty3-I Gag-Pol polyprotein, putative / transcript_product=Transposon Ty3-I Gag-Pol polyprotein, putative / location=Cvel_scaffold2674:9869-10180(-) / protein_length=104 / sequence_SO=supercontig / SO=protein_coding / is_pseudo=false